MFQTILTKQNFAKKKPYQLYVIHLLNKTQVKQSENVKTVAA